MTLPVNGLNPNIKIIPFSGTCQYYVLIVFCSLFYAVSFPSLVLCLSFDNLLHLDENDPMEHVLL